MTNTDDDHGAIPGEAPDTRPCVAVNVSLRMAIIEAQIALQHELRQGGAGGQAASLVSAGNADTTSVLGIPAASPDVCAPATVAERLVLLRNELAVLRARLDAPDAMLPSPHLAMGVAPLVMALPEQYLAALLGLSDDEIELAWLAVAWAVQPALFDELIVDAPLRGVSAALFVRLRRFVTVVDERAFVVALRTSKLFTLGMLQRAGEDNGLHTEWRAAPSLVEFFTGALVHDA